MSAQATGSRCSARSAASASLSSPAATRSTSNARLRSTRCCGSRSRSPTSRRRSAGSQLANHACARLPRPMSVTAVRTPAEYESQLRRYLYDRSEEGRAVRVGEKEVSERAEIVERYRDLFSREQLDALCAAEQEAADDNDRERLYRLRKTCEAGVVSAELAEREDALENAILAARVDFKGEELPIRSAQAKLAVLPDYGEREELGEASGDRSAEFNAERLEVLRAAEELEAEISGQPDPVARNEEEKGISLRELEAVLAQASERSTAAYVLLRDRWFERLLGPERAKVPSSYHVAYLRRLSPLESTYTKDRAIEVCMDTVKRLGFDLENEPNIRLDLDDRPQKSPRACVIPSDPPSVVHLITRAQGGLHDYQAFLREPEWHAQYFGLSDEEAARNAEATSFLEAVLFRRYTAKLQFELDFWSRFNEDGGGPDGYEERLTEATGVRYRADAYLADMDGGFYSADYLRAWIRSAQLRDYLVREIGEDWWRNAETGDRLRALFLEGTRPSSEEIAARLGYQPLDTAPLLRELGV